MGKKKKDIKLDEMILLFPLPMCDSNNTANNAAIATPISLSLSTAITVLSLYLSISSPSSLWKEFRWLVSLNNLNCELSTSLCLCVWDLKASLLFSLVWFSCCDVMLLLAGWLAGCLVGWLVGCMLKGTHKFADDDLCIYINIYPLALICFHWGLTTTGAKLCAILDDLADSKQTNKQLRQFLFGSIYSIYLALSLYQANCP